MKKTQKIFTSALAFFLALLMTGGILPVAATQVETDAETESEVVSGTEGETTGESESETVVVVDRGIPDDKDAAVFIDGKLHQSGSFKDMWKEALKQAPKSSDINKEVEFVLNKNWVAGQFGSGDGYDDGSIEIAPGKALTIDLNGYVLARTDGSNIIKSGSVITIEDEAALTIKDSNPTRKHYGKVKDNLWKFDKSATSGTEISGGIITGGYLRNFDGGGIMARENSMLVMTGGTIAGNHADYGGGIAADPGCVITLSDKVNICYNAADKGGGINLEKAKLYGGNIHHNHASDEGGGIHTQDEGASEIKDVVVENNKAKKGGGIANCGVDTQITGATVKNNTASSNGGGIYLGKNMYLKDSSVTENVCTSNNGGGIGMADGKKIMIVGKIVIDKNHYVKKEKNKTTEIDSDLYLPNNNNMEVDTLTKGSSIGIRTKKAASSYTGPSNKLTQKASKSTGHYFFSNETGYYVEWQADPLQDNHRYLYLKKGTRPDTLQELTDYAVDKNYSTYTALKDGVKYPLYRGYVEFNLMTDSHSAAAPFFYSDGYFAEDPTNYNTHLATMSANMALAAFGRTTDQVGDNKYANHFANVKQLMSDIGCDDADFFANIDYQMKPQLFEEEGRFSTIGVAISKKNIEIGGQTYILMPIAIRGGGYEIEWASNVTLGTEGEAKGFADAADQTFAHVQRYVKDHGLEQAANEGKIKFWVVGYSRAGATANLTSKRLVDAYGLANNQVFGYTFEAPMGGVEEAIVKEAHTNDGKYLSIHNTINENDFVTLVAPSRMGFFRYGVDHLIASDYNNGNGVIYDKDTRKPANPTAQYWEQRALMVKQLAAISPDYQFDDYWEMADIFLVESNLPFGRADLVEPYKTGANPNVEAENIYTYLRWFFDRIQLDGLFKGRWYVNGGPDYYRDQYSSSSVLARYGAVYSQSLHPSHPDYNYGASPMSPEQAARTMMKLMYTLSSEDMAKIGEIMVNNLMSHTLKQPNIVLQGFALAALYKQCIFSWHKLTVGENQVALNALVSFMMFERQNKTSEIWDYIPDDMERDFAEALPSLLAFILNFASADYQMPVTERWGMIPLKFADDGMWCTGTFINNMNVIVSNHYQEVTLAWVRSYDSYYDNELTPYVINNKKTEKPVAEYDGLSSPLTLNAAPGSSIFYSLDNGSTWELYTTPVVINNPPEIIKAFAISRGTKSEILDIRAGGWTGSMFADGNVWFVVAGSAMIVAGAVLTLEMSRRRKKSSATTEDN